MCVCVCAHVCGGHSNSELIEWMPEAFEQFSGWLYDYYFIDWFGGLRLNKNSNGTKWTIDYEILLNVDVLRIKWYGVAYSI